MNEHTPKFLKDKINNFLKSHKKLASLLFVIFVIWNAIIFSAQVKDSILSIYIFFHPTKIENEPCIKQPTFVETTGNGKSVIDDLTYVDHTGKGCPPEILKTIDNGQATATKIKIEMLK